MDSQNKKSDNKSVQIAKDFHRFIALDAVKRDISIKDLLEISFIFYQVIHNEQEIKKELIKWATAKDIDKPSKKGSTFEERLMAWALEIYTTK